MITDLSKGMAGPFVSAKATYHVAEYFFRPWNNFGNQSE